jgi:hypothetical protein
MALVCLALPIAAQVDTGTILGTVRDPTGAVVPGAKITVSNEGTAFTQVTTTSGSGTYVVTPLRIGAYTVEVEQPGFKKQRRTGQELNIQQQLVVDFSLEPGEVTTTVDVNEEAPILQTENGSVGQVVGGERSAAQRPQLHISGASDRRRKPGAAGGQRLERQRLVRG